MAARPSLRPRESCHAQESARRAERPAWVKGRAPNTRTKSRGERASVVCHHLPKNLAEVS
jgi:hypothetical protein